VTVPSDRQSFSRKQVRRLLNLPANQLRAWERQGLIAHQDPYDFHDLIALKTLARLRAGRVPVARIRRALDALRQKLAGIGDPLTEVKLFADGPRIHVHLGGQTMEPITGQLLLDFDQRDLEGLVSFPSATAAGNARDRRRRADAWFQKGLESEKDGAPVEEVIVAYENALELDPQLAAALVNLGTIWFTAREWEKSEKCYRRALEANHDYALAHFNLGNLYDERGDRNNALFHYLAALQIDPRYADAHYNLALLYQAAGQWMKAVRHWQLYLKLDRASQWADIARKELAKIYEATVVPGRKEYMPPRRRDRGNG